MPQLTFKGIREEDVREMSRDLPEALADLSDTPVAYFTMAREEARYFAGGASSQPYPMVEVVQFARPQEVERAMATCIASAVRKRGYATCDVYFIHLAQEAYYEWRADAPEEGI